MAKPKVEEVVEELATPIIEENNCKLVDIEYAKEGPNWYLRVYIDKEQGVTVDDCQKVSESLSDQLDRVDPIVHSYILEVSSPGLDRPLKSDRDFEYFKGRDVDIKLYSPIDGKKEYSGTLIGLENGIIMVESQQKKLEFTRDKVASVRLTFKL